MVGGWWKSGMKGWLQQILSSLQKIKVIKKFE